MPLNRRDFIATALAGTAIAAAGPRLSQAQTKRPNVLFILADDLGYGDVSCFGRPDYQTPNIDRLAAQGVRFVNAYSAAPLCTPTRCAFITGRYPARTRVGLEEPLTEKGDLGERAKILGLPADHPTIASLLKQSGYQTALIGKWHLGYLPNFGPVQSGFDEFFGIMSGAADFFTHKDMRGDGDLYEGKVPVERIGYMTEMLTQRAVKYITDRRKGSGTASPFYLSLHYTAPHWPWEGPRDQEVSRTLGKGYDGFTAGGSLKTYAAMMKSLDDGIGEVLRAVDQSGLASNTLVIFTSDNGGERFSYNWPFRGQKFNLWEGGIRVPAIVRLPGAKSNVQSPKSKVAMRSQDSMRSQEGGLPPLLSVPPAVAGGLGGANQRSSIADSPGRIIHDTAITMDWTATILAAAGAKPDPSYPLDGIDLMPIIRSASLHPRVPASPPLPVPASPPLPVPASPRLLFWRTSVQDAALQGRWKYVRDGEQEYLFDLSVDEREQANFREQNPAMFTQLRDAFKQWEATLLPRPPARRRM